MVLHNWADEYCVRILKHLRVAAGPETQLVIVEQLPTCACDEPATHEIPGAELPVAPKPLLPNWGRASHSTDASASLVSITKMSMCTDALDMSQMIALFNGQVRTITSFRSLLDKTGWKLITVHHNAPSGMLFQRVTAVPN